MILQEEKQSLIVKVGNIEPKEQKSYIIQALSSALRWYAQVPNKRKADEDHAATLSDLIVDLSEPK